MMLDTDIKQIQIQTYPNRQPLSATWCPCGTSSSSRAASTSSSLPGFTTTAGLGIALLESDLTFEWCLFGSLLSTYLLSLASIYAFIPLQQNFHFHLDNICLFLRIFGISFPSWYHTSPILEWWILTKSHLSDLGFGGARTITFSSTALSKLTLPTMAPPSQGRDIFIITNTNVDTNTNKNTNTNTPPAFRGGHLLTNTNVDTDTITIIPTFRGGNLCLKYW